MDSSVARCDNLAFFIVKRCGDASTVLHAESEFW